MAALITGERRYSDEALRQLEALFDRRQWPVWCDRAHGTEADLRTGSLSRDVAFAYDWMWPVLTADERKWVVEGIDRCGIQPYLRSVEAGAWWLNCHNNWLSCVVGGLGIAGMCLGEDHPRSQELIDIALPRMTDYLNMYGPEGEFNESVAYSGATILPALFFTAHLYWRGNSENALARWPFPETCRWDMYFMVPPGHIVPFGDSHLNAPLAPAYFAAVAGAARDGVLQWWYLNHLEESDRRALHWELLWFDPTLAAEHPDDAELPRGRAFRAHSACISSRTDWNARWTYCVVYGKGGHGSEGHGNHDAGQVCIDGCAQRLIVDLGLPSMYPADFFGPNRYEYYNASVRGHNVFTFGAREMRSGEESRAEILDAAFDDFAGGYWVLDLTGLYDGARSVRRSVVHLHPGIVAVLDEAELATAEDVSMRWHTADRCEPDADGRFTVAGDGVQLEGLIVRLDEGAMTVRRGEHGYEAPFDRGRLGDPLDQRRESYIEAALRGERCRLLTLFVVWGPEQTPGRWERDGQTWRLQTAEGRVRVTCDAGGLVVRNEDAETEWRAG